MLKNNIKIYFILMLITIFHISMQIYFFHINNEVPTDGDGVNYISRASNFTDFANVFGDGFRLPGYPFVIWFLGLLSGKSLLFIRIIQVILTSSLIIISFFILLKLTRSKFFSLFGGIIVGSWLPLYVFSKEIYAESISLFLIALLILIIIDINTNNYLLKSILISILIALLTYLKPNQIMILLPTCIYCVYKLKNWSTIKKHLQFTIGLLMILIMPWTIFISVTNSSFIPLSTNQGLVLYQGAGGSDGIEYYTLSDKVRKYFNLNNTDLNVYEVLSQYNEKIDPEHNDHKKAVTYNKMFQSKAIELWKERPLEEVILGFAKVLHGFGFSLRGLKDIVLALFSLTSILTSIILWRTRKHRDFILLFWMLIFIFSFQAFLYQGDQRFKTILFDLPAILILLLALNVLKNNMAVSMIWKGWRKIARPIINNSNL
ncbi:hypothetical protein A8709_10730 [Paenibacillus pectinilyticus]|uniref:Uncharacterized protein n=1 Tax=Paenibacillus pectinilyticus TaxID=512399 RepID=A0A1C1A695_9BACL|nr:glycosyltransferase family 39 protein [Paenibacillus pectinilyticus]OCT16078.1 hypothetical protein A8709_10730 [Paenibacillus pectinilyticus]